jgi:leader peptidase (prepilin peptidase)/N-methyltransferase
MITDLSISPTLLALLGLIFGAVMGSFLNVVILRLPRIMNSQWTSDARAWLDLESQSEQVFNLATPASHCPQCGTPIKPLHNIPILSYLFLRGRCAHCDAPISLQYPVIETLTAVLAAYLLVLHGLSAIALSSIIFTCSLLVLAVIDQRHKLLPDQITLPLLWLGLLVNLDSLYTTTQSAVIGAVVGYLSLWVVYWLFKLATGKEGMGYGDFKLVAAIGAWLGWKVVPLIIFLSSAVAAVVGVCAIFFAGREKDLPLAFGPYLCISGWIALQWGDSIIAWYFSFFTI